MPHLPTFDKKTVKALRKGEEPVLERILRESYAAMVEDATRQMGGGDGAPRVVQNAILQLWEERARIEEPEELEHAIRQAVHGHAILEVRHRAAPHEAQGKPAAPQAPAPANVDEVWKRVVAALHAPKAAAGPAHKHAPDAALHGAASHIAEVAAPRSKLGPVVGGVVMLAAVSVGLWWANRKGAESSIDRSFSSPEASTQSSRPGQRGMVTLSDSSRVTLGSDSKVIVPPIFREKGRIVKLEGSATFAVTASELDPFEVRAGNIAIIASGTEFSVRFFAGEDAVIVRVKEGQVTVKSPQESRALAAGGGVAVAKDGTMREASADVLEHAFAWTEGRFTITNKPLREALPEFRRWFDLNMAVPDTELLDRPVTVSLPLDKTKDAVAALEKSASVKFVYEKNKPVLRDAGAKAKKR